MADSDYMEKAVEAAENREQQQYDNSELTYVRPLVEAAEPFIAEHHRADERARKNSPKPRNLWTLSMPLSTQSPPKGSHD